MKEQMKEGQRRRRCLLKFGIVLLLLIFVGCRSVEVVEYHHRDTIWAESVRIDSVKLVDSVIVNTYTLGDTVYIERIKTEYRDRVKIVADTVVKVDTIVKEVPAEQSSSIWEQIRNMIEELKWLMVVAFGGWIVWRFFR